MTETSVTPQHQKKKPGMSQVLIPVALILSGVLVGLSLLGKKDAEKTGDSHFELVAGTQIPELKFKTLDGETVPMSRFTQKILLINFWATWCGPCVEEMPSLVKLQADFHEKSFQILAVNEDENPSEVLIPFVKRNKMEFPNFIDPQGELSEKFEIQGLPISILLDSKRRVLSVEMGSKDWSSVAVKKQIEGWLDQVDL